MSSSPDLSPIRPVFVGGSGRSGTTPTSRLLGRHSRLAMVPAELRVHVRPRGLVDLLEGGTALAEFVERMEGRWYKRPKEEGLRDDREDAGLFEILEREALLPVLERFQAEYSTDRWLAARHLMHGLLDGVAVTEGKDGWVEHSPENVTVAARLHRILPDMVLVHSLRDGRDVASSMLRVPWGPTGYRECLRWWGRRLRVAHGELSRLPGERLFLLRLEELVATDREGAYGSLLAFLGLEDEPGIHGYFDENIDPERAHIGRWRDDVPAGEHGEVDLLYEGILHTLRRDGVPLPAGADDFDRLDGPRRELAMADQDLYEAGAEAAEALEAVARLREDLGRAEERREMAEEQRERAREQRDRISELRDKARETIDKTRALLKTANEEKAELAHELQLLREARR